jgi:uncharacterized protein (UPF0264 family)
MQEILQSPRRVESGLLVSVRSGEEALRALRGGADLIDVKEPLHGSLGRAEDAVIAEVIHAVGQACPVSAALGEWVEGPGEIPALDLTFVKWGLAGCRQRQDWRQGLAQQLIPARRPQVVLTAYADWECARAPGVEEVFALAGEHPGSVLLLDTHCKEANNPLTKRRPTLLDWLPVASIEDLCGRCREARVRIALAGSLGEAEIQALLQARPDWFAVRGAVCEEGRRGGAVQEDKVRRLVNLLRGRPVQAMVQRSENS